MPSSDNLFQSVFAPDLEPFPAMPSSDNLFQSVFAPDLEPFPAMPSSDNLFVIEEDQEAEELLKIEEFSKEMGRK